MIKATELRIGNLVLDSTGNVHKIERLDEKWDFSDRNPIPLTEDWLVRFGFEKEVKQSDSVYISDNVYRLNIFEYATSCGTMNLEIDYYDQHASFTTNIKYVHQLQNLYFLLTGEELILK